MSRPAIRSDMRAWVVQDFDLRSPTTQVAQNVDDQQSQIA
jgi:hypothetical protein